MRTLFLSAALAACTALVACDVSSSITPPESPAFADFRVNLERGCESASAWADVQANDLPTEWSDISLLPPEYRTQVLDRLKPAQRHALWLSQIAFYLGDDGELSQPQRDALAGLRDVLTPAMFEPNSTALTDAIDFDELGEVLGEKAQTVLYQAGYPYLPDLVETSAGGATAQSNSYPQFCNCNNQDTSAGGYCPTYYGEGAGCFVTSGCASTSTGCGPLDNQSCIGTCSQEPIEPGTTPGNGPGGDNCSYNPDACDQPSFCERFPNSTSCFNDPVAQ